MKKVIAYLHTHWDREWYRPFEEFRLRLIEVFDDVLENLENGNIPCFYFDGQVAALKDYLEIRPEKLALIKYFIKEKKLYIGPFYCSSDSFLVSAESLYRNLQLGINYSKELGQDDFIAYIADSFGHSKDLPIILKSLKLSKAILWRGLGDLDSDLNWNGIKTVNLIQGYFQDFFHSDLSIEKIAENLKNYLDKISEKSNKLILLPIGGDHLAIPKKINETIKQLNNIYEDYKITLGSPFDYFYRIYELTNIRDEFLNNDKTFILKGVYSTRPYIKKSNAQLQWLLERITEPLNAFSTIFFNIKNRQNEINYAYNELIKNHAHDSIYGCSTDEVVDDVISRYRNVKTISNGVIKRIIRDLSNNNGDFSVINLSNFRYSGKIFIETDKELPKYLNAIKVSTKKSFTDEKLYNINDIPLTEDYTYIHKYLVDVKNLEPFSLTKITLDKIYNEKHIKTDKYSIENNYIKLEILNNRIIVTDKINKEIYGDFIQIRDRADIGDSYNFGALKYDKVIKAKLKSFEINENNIQAVLSAVYEIDIPLYIDNNRRSSRIDKCKINLDFILYNQSKMVEIKVQWLNKSKNHILQIGFNLKEKITSTISEDLLSTVKRDIDPDYDIYKNIPTSKGIELKTNTFPMQRFVNTQNLTIITKGINEYEINRNTILLTMLRATGIISNPDNTTRGTPAGPPIETPNMQCLNEMNLQFAFSFTNDTETMYKLAEEFYYPCVSLFSNLDDKIFYTPKDRVYSITLEDGHIKSRAYTGLQLKNVIIK